MDYLLSDHSKIRQSEDLAIRDGRAHAGYFLDRLAVDEQLLFVNTVHPLNGLLDRCRIVLEIDGRNIFGRHCSKDWRVSADDYPVDVVSRAVFGDEAKVAVFASEVMLSNCSKGSILVLARHVVCGVVVCPVRKRRVVECCFVLVLSYKTRVRREGAKGALAAADQTSHCDNMNSSFKTHPSCKTFPSVDTTPTSTAIPKLM